MRFSLMKLINYLSSICLPERRPTKSETIGVAAVEGSLPFTEHGQNNARNRKFFTEDYTSQGNYESFGEAGGR